LVKPGTGGAAAFKAKRAVRQAASIKKYGTKSVVYRGVVEKVKHGKEVDPKVLAAAVEAQKKEAREKPQYIISGREVTREQYERAIAEQRRVARRELELKHLTPEERFQLEQRRKWEEKGVKYGYEVRGREVTGEEFFRERAKARAKAEKEWQAQKVKAGFKPYMIVKPKEEKKPFLVETPRMKRYKEVVEKRLKPVEEYGATIGATLISPITTLHPKTPLYLKKVSEEAGRAIFGIPKYVAEAPYYLYGAGRTAELLRRDKEAREKFKEDLKRATRETLGTTAGWIAVGKTAVSPEFVGGTLGYLAVGEAVRLGFKATPLYRKVPIEPLERVTAIEQAKALKKDVFYHAAGVKPKKMKVVLEELGRRGAGKERKPFEEYFLFTQKKAVSPEFGKKGVLEIKAKPTPFSKKAMKEIEAGLGGAELRRKLVTEVKRQPGKIFPGTRTAALPRGKLGEFEFVIAAGTRLYGKRRLPQWTTFYEPGIKPPKTPRLRDYLKIRREFVPLREVGFKKRRIPVEEELGLLGKEFLAKLPKGKKGMFRRIPTTRLRVRIGLPILRIPALLERKITRIPRTITRPFEIQKIGRPTPTPKRDMGEVFRRVPPSKRIPPQFKRTPSRFKRIPPQFRVPPPPKKVFGFRMKPKEDKKKKLKDPFKEWKRAFEYRPSLAAIERPRIKKAPSSLKEWLGVGIRPVVLRKRKMKW